MIADWRPFWLGGLGTPNPPNPPVLPNPQPLDAPMGVVRSHGREETPPPPEDTKITKRKKKGKKMLQVNGNVAMTGLPEKKEGGPE